MKNYLSTKRGNSRQARLPRAFFGTLIVLVVLTGALYVVPRLIHGVVATVLYPFEAVRTWVLESNDSLPNYLRERHTLVTEIETLQQQVAVQMGSDSTLAKLTAENETFRALCEAVPEERVIARVVGRPPYLPYDVLMLDRGTIHGVKEAAPVFAGQDQVIGYVSRVYEKTALVTLVSTAGFRSMAYIIGPNIYTYAEGVGSGMLRVIVPQGIPLQVGDTVILPAIDSGSYGQISYIETSPTNPEQLGYVPMDMNLQQIQYVSVGHEPIIPHSYEAAEALVKELRTDLFSVNLPPGVLVTPLLATSSATTTATTTGTSTTP